MVKINGVLVKDTQILKVAVNNYRYNGGSGAMAAAVFTPGSKATSKGCFNISWSKVTGANGYGVYRAIYCFIPKFLL